MSFEQMHEAWIKQHLDRRTGERKGRLERGHRHGEQLFARSVWWEVFGHFEHLHPEFELTGASSRIALSGDSHISGKTTHYFHGNCINTR